MVAAAVENCSSSSSGSSGGGEGSMASPGHSGRKRRLSNASGGSSVPAHYLRNGGNHTPKSKDSTTKFKPSAPAKFGQNVRITVCANQGGRKYMEDRVHIHSQRDSTGLLDYIYVAVYDGHGGAEASVFAKKHLLNTILEQRGFDSGTDAGMLEAIKEGFLQTHEAMTKVVDRWPRTASGFTSTSGTTASVAFIRNGKLYTGHVGDSQIVAGVQHGNNDDTIRSDPITIDHKPDSPQELKRIEDSGGLVMCKAGVMRVVWTRPVRGHVGPVRRSTPQENIPFLAVARALGDLWSFNEDFNEYVVSPKPDLDLVELTKGHKCIVLGSDGLSNVIKPQNCIDIVNAHEWRELKEQGKSTDSASILNRSCHSNHSRWLIRNALRGWGSLRADNISVITVIFDPPDAELDPRSECIYKPGVNLDIEGILTQIPDAMIRITPTTTQVLKTVPVELVYSGAVDMALSAPSSFPGYNGVRMSAHVTTVSYSGPGFSSYSKEMSIRRQNSAPTSKPRASLSSTPIQNSRSSLGFFFSSESSELEEESTEDENWNDMRSRGRSNPASETGNDKYNAAKGGGTPGKKRTFYCTKHGLTCEKVKKLNDAAAGNNPDRLKALLDKTKVKNRRDTSTETKEERRKAMAAGIKPKYFCRKHGLSCAKVKRMNEEYVKQQMQLSSPDVKSPSAVTVDDSDSSPDEKEKKTPPKSATHHRKIGRPTKRRMTTGGSALRKGQRATTTPGVKVARRRALSLTKKQRSAIGTPVIRAGAVRYQRKTRAGTQLSPSRSLPSMKSLNRSEVVVARKKSAAARRLSLSAPRKNASGDQPVENSYQHIRSRLNSIRDDVRKSAHHFRVRKLRYCLRKPVSQASGFGTNSLSEKKKSVSMSKFVVAEKIGKRQAKRASFPLATEVGRSNGGQAGKIDRGRNHSALDVKADRPVSVMSDTAGVSKARSGRKSVGLSSPAIRSETSVGVIFGARRESLRSSDSPKVDRAHSNSGKKVSSKVLKMAENGVGIDTEQERKSGVRKLSMERKSLKRLPIHEFAGSVSSDNGKWPSAMCNGGVKRKFSGENPPPEEVGVEATETEERSGEEPTRKRGRFWTDRWSSLLNIFSVPTTGTKNG